MFSWNTDLNKTRLSFFRALDDRGYPDKYFSYFSTKIHDVGSHQKCLMSTHNICFFLNTKTLTCPHYDI